MVLNILPLRMNKAFFNFITLISLVVSLAGCETNNNPVIPIDQNKIGGFYETSTEGMKFDTYDGKTSYTLTSHTIPFTHFTSMQLVDPTDGPDPGIIFTLTDKGKQLFKEMSTRNVNKPICFVIKGKVMSAPIVMEPINSNTITLTGKKEEMEHIMAYLKNKK